MSFKSCRDCGVQKPLDDFHRNRLQSDGRTCYCKPCATARAKAHYEANRSKAIANAKARTAGLSAIERLHWSRVKTLRKYGLSLEDYARMFDEQDGKCALCHRTESDCFNGRQTAFAVDHSHETGEVRGLLCRFCNMAIAIFDACPEAAERIKAYMERGK